MSHFVRKPTTVEAIQWHDGDEPVYDNMGNLIETVEGSYVSRDTMTGEVEVFPKEWFETVYERTDSPLIPPNVEAASPQTVPTEAPSPVNSPTFAPEPPESPASGTAVSPGQPGTTL